MIFYIPMNLDIQPALRHCTARAAGRAGKCPPHSHQGSRTRIIFQKILQIRLLSSISKMHPNPFDHPQSPIAHLYQRSKSRSLSNRVPMRSRTKSFRQFQVKTITAALDKQHIIQKVAGSEKEKEIKRERQISKYYGVESLRLEYNNSPAHPHLQANKARKPAEPPAAKTSSNRNSEQISTLINIKPTTVNCINSQRYMSYESNYFINREPKESENAISSANSFFKPSSARSSERRISFFSQLSNNPYQDGSEHKKSRFVNEKRGRIDRVKEDHFDEDYMLQRNNKVSYKYYA